MKILLIDDDLDDQTLFCEALKQIAPEIRCDTAINGREGLKLLSGYTTLPHLVFLDVNMPIMDGREALKAIKSTAGLQSLNIIIYSTSNSKDEVDWFTRFGVRFITKPNSFEELVSLLRKTIFDMSSTAPEIAVMNLEG